MNKNEVLTSGLLERYILGETSSSEAAMVESWIAKDAEVKAAFQKMELDFERMAEENAVTPPSHVKAQILKEIAPSKSATQSNWYLGVAAALVLMMGLTSYFQYQKMQKIEDELKIVQQQKELIESELESVVTSYAKTTEMLEFMGAPTTQKYLLNANELAQNATAIGYVNPSAKKVLIDANALPKLDDDKDYQLWADVHGEMINMGLIKKEKALLAYNYIEDSESLNITIEPAGGSAHPTVANLVANVYLR